MNGFIEFEVQGAGNLIVSLDDKHHTGTAYGCSIKCSWDKHGGKYGGVMDRSEMEHLRDHLTALLGDKQ